MQTAAVAASATAASASAAELMAAVQSVATLGMRVPAGHFP
jgi:hypothetical protein